MEFRHAGAAWLTRVDYGIQRALRGFGIPGTRQLVLYKLNLYPGTVSTWFCLEKVGKKLKKDPVVPHPCFFNIH